MNLWREFTVEWIFFKLKIHIKETLSSRKFHYFFTFAFTVLIFYFLHVDDMKSFLFLSVITQFLTVATIITQITDVIFFSYNNVRHVARHWRRKLSQMLKKNLSNAMRIALWLLWKLKKLYQRKIKTQLMSHYVVEFVYDFHFSCNNSVV